MNIDFKNIRLSNGKTIPEMLKSEADRFVRILQEEVDLWYSTYQPKVYDRSFAMRDSLSVSDYITVKANNRKFSIDIHFNDNAFSTGYWNRGTINKLLLMNDGYSVQKDTWFKDIPNFGYRKGGRFIESAIARFNIDNSLGITIRLCKGGKIRSG